MIQDRTQRPGGVVAGALLVVVGILLLVVTQLGVGGEVVPAAIGVGFLVVYAFQPRYGFLVAGSIMTGLGAGIVVETHFNTAGAAVLLGLGLGFCAIYGIDLAVSRLKHSTLWWPLVPGVILLGIGLLVASQNFGELAWIGRWWPLALVVLGVLLLLGRPGRGSASSA